MKGILVALSVLINCDKGAGPSCKDALEKSLKAAHISDREITLAIGKCEQQTWSNEARSCLAIASSSDAVNACGAKFSVDVPKANSFAEAIKKMTEFKDHMCACRDTACAQLVSDEMTKWAEEQAKDQQAPPKMSEDDVKQATAIGEEMGKCMQRAMTPPPSQSPRPGNPKLPF